MALDTMPGCWGKDFAERSVSSFAQRFRLFDAVPATSGTSNDKSILYQDAVSTKTRASAVFGGSANEALLDD